MAGVKGIIGTFFPFWKAAESFILADGVKLVPPTGDQFMGIDLMAHIPDQLVVGGVEDVVEGQGKLDNTQAGS